MNYVAYSIGTIVGIIYIMASLTPDFLFITAVILSVLLGVVIYILLYAAIYVVINQEPPNSELLIKLQNDWKLKRLYRQATFAACLVIFLPMVFSITNFTLVSYFWMTAAVIHVYLLWDLVYYSTTKYADDIRKSANR